jgi:hypothetical protein
MRSMGGWDWFGAITYKEERASKEKLTIFKARLTSGKTAFLPEGSGSTQPG